MNHELRVPMTPIKGSEAAVLGTSSVINAGEMQQFCRIIDGQADHMLELISDLLDVAPKEAGALLVSPEPTGAILVDRARNTFLGGGCRNNIQIDLPTGHPRVMADRRRVVQVLGNPPSNAPRHSPASSTIRVSAAREGVLMSFSVTDDSVGVSVKRLPHLFQKFSRLDDEERGKGIAGSGLGLAICEGIVEAHGGRIWAESDGPGLSAKFTFTLPGVEDATIVSTRYPTRFGQVLGQQARVLEVDDDPLALRYVRDALSNAEFSVVATGDAG